MGLVGFLDRISRWYQMIPWWTCGLMGVFLTYRDSSESTTKGPQLWKMSCWKSRGTGVALFPFFLFKYVLTKVRRGQGELGFFTFVPIPPLHMVIMLVEIFFCVSADSPNFPMHVWLSEMRVAAVCIGGSHSMGHWGRRPHLEQVDCPHGQMMGKDPLLCQLLI